MTQEELAEDMNKYPLLYVDWSSTIKSRSLIDAWRIGDRSPFTKDDLFRYLLNDIEYEKYKIVEFNPFHGNSYKKIEIKNFTGKGTPDLGTWLFDEDNFDIVLKCTDKVLSSCNKKEIKVFWENVYNISKNYIGQGWESRNRRYDMGKNIEYDSLSYGLNTRLQIPFYHDISKAKLNYWNPVVLSQMYASGLTADMAALLIGMVFPPEQKSDIKNSNIDEMTSEEFKEYIYNKEGISLYPTDEYDKFGFISPNGDFYKCKFSEHEEFAEYMLLSNLNKFKIIIKGKNYSSEKRSEAINNHDFEYGAMEALLSNDFIAIRQFSYSYVSTKLGDFYKCDYKNLLNVITDKQFETIEKIKIF